MEDNKIDYKSCLSCLDEEEVKYIVDTIPIEVYIKYFQNSPKEFTKIKPGFRATSIKSREQIDDIVLRNLGKDFISSFLEKQIKGWLSQIDKAITQKLKDGKDKKTALLLTLPQCFFVDKISIWFKLIDEKYSEESISLIDIAIKIIRDYGSKNEELDSVIELNRSKIDIQQKELDKIKGELEKNKVKLNESSSKITTLTRANAELEKLRSSFDLQVIEITTLKKETQELRLQIQKLTHKLEIANNGVYNEWEQLNSEKIAEAKAEFERIIVSISAKRENVQSEFSLIQEQIEVLSHEREEIKRQKVTLENKIAELQSDYESKLGIANDIVKQVQNKITLAKTDISSFFAEYAMFCGDVAISSPMPEAQKKFAIIHGTIIDNETPDVIKDKKELFEVLKDNLEAVGVDKTLCSVLGAYLLSAYFLNVPLTIAGYGANAIIDALSATLFNRKAGQVIGELFTQEQTDNDKIIAVNNGFGYMDKVLQLAHGSYVYFIAQTSEELILEPRSSYNYALPLFTEYFVTNNVCRELYGTISEVKFQISDRELKPTFAEHILPPLAFKNIKTLLGNAMDLYKEMSEYEKHLLVTLPIMLASNRREELLDLLSESSLSDKDKQKLYMWIGEKQ